MARLATFQHVAVCLLWHPSAPLWPCHGQGGGCFIAMIIERFLGASQPSPLQDRLHAPSAISTRAYAVGDCTCVARFPIQFLVATAHLDPADSRTTLVVVDKCAQRFCTHYCTNVPWLFARAAGTNTMLAQLGFVVCGVAVMMTLHLLTRWGSCSCSRR